MTDRQNCARGVAVASYRCGRSAVDDRRTSRAMMAGIVAFGLTVSASLYPTPGESPIIGVLDGPGIDNLLSLPNLIDWPSSKRTVKLDGAAYPELMQVAKLLIGNPGAVSVDSMLALTHSYGLHGVDVTQLQILVDYLEYVQHGDGGTHYAAEVFGTEGFSIGGGVGYSAASPTMLLEWMLLLNSILNRLPATFFGSLTEGIARMLPGVIGPSDIRSSPPLAVAVQAPAASVPPPSVPQLVVPAQSPVSLHETPTSVSTAPPATSPPAAAPETYSVTPTYVTPEPVEPPVAMESPASTPPAAPTETAGAGTGIGDVALSDDVEERLPDDPPEAGPVQSDDTAQDAGAAGTGAGPAPAGPEAGDDPSGGGDPSPSSTDS